MRRAGCVLRKDLTGPYACTYGGSVGSMKSRGEG